MITFLPDLVRFISGAGACANLLYV